MGRRAPTCRRKRPKPQCSCTTKLTLVLVLSVLLYQLSRRNTPSTLPLHSSQAPIAISPNTTHNATRVQPKPHLHPRPRRRRKRKHHYHFLARTSGAMPAFTGCNISTTGMLRGQNVTRVSYTLYKLIRLFGLKSMIDSPAGSHVIWMPELIRRISYEMPSFRYKALDDNSAGLLAASRAMEDVIDGEFVRGDVETLTAGAELLFHWTELDGSERDPRQEGYGKHLKKVLLRAKKDAVSYVIVGQFPRLRGPVPEFRHGNWRWEGGQLSVPPFYVNDYVRGVVAVENSARPYMLYLTLYAAGSIPLHQLHT